MESGGNKQRLNPMVLPELTIRKTRTSSINNLMFVRQIISRLISQTELIPYNMTPSIAIANAETDTRQNSKNASNNDGIIGSSTLHIRGTNSDICKTERTQ
jgi:hypothetical protein